MTNFEFELIQIAVGTRTKFSATPNIEDWQRIYGFAEKQSLVGVLFGAIEKFPKEQLPQMDLLMDWLGQAEYIKSQNQTVNENACRISAIFEDNGFQTCVLKGQGLAQVYPTPELRQSGDIDLWVNAPVADVVKFCKKKWSVKHIDIKNLVIDDYQGTSLEVHFIPGFLCAPVYGRRFSKWIEGQKPYQFSSAVSHCGYNSPDIYFNLVYNLVHIYRHVFQEGIGLRQLMDYYYVLMASTREDREKSVAAIGSIGLTSFASAVMYVLQKIFLIDDNHLLCTPNENRGIRLLSEILEGGNFGHFGNAINNASENDIMHGWRLMMHNLRLIREYPLEVIAEPFWKIKHWLWRLTQGYNND